MSDERTDDQRGGSIGPGARLIGAIRRLHGREGGATLTEFIVVLPVFLTVFVFILRFGVLQSTTIQLQMAATKDMWDQATPAQNARAPAQRFTHPNDAAGASLTIVNEPNADRAFSDPIDEDMAIGIGEGNTGEMAAAVDDSQADQYADLDKLPPSVQGNIEADARDVLERQKFSAYRHDTLYSEFVADDEQGRVDTGPPTARSPLDNMNLNPSNTNRETNAAYAAGVRYGLVQADRRPPASAVADIPGITQQDLHVGYNTLVAPYPVVEHENNGQHYRPVGTARRLMEQKTPYREVYGLDLNR